MNMMSQQAMVLLKNHEYIVSQRVDYRLHMYVTLEQNFVNLMTQHMTEIFYNANNTKSLELKVLLEKPNAIYAELQY
jgi:hypothetical protein